MIEEAVRGFILAHSRYEDYADLPFEFVQLFSWFNLIINFLAFELNCKLKKVNIKN